MAPERKHLPKVVTDLHASAEIDAPTYASHPCRRANPCPDFEKCGEKGFIRKYIKGQCVSHQGEKLCIYSTVNTRQPCASKARSMDTGVRVHKVQDVSGAYRKVLATIGADDPRAVIVQTGEDVVQLVPSSARPGAAGARSSVARTAVRPASLALGPRQNRH